MFYILNFIYIVQNIVKRIVKPGIFWPFLSSVRFWIGCYEKYPRIFLTAKKLFKNVWSSDSELLKN